MRGSSIVDFSWAESRLLLPRSPNFTSVVVTSDDLARMMVFYLNTFEIEDKLRRCVVHVLLRFKIVARVATGLVVSCNNPMWRTRIKFLALARVIYPVKFLPATYISWRYTPAGSRLYKLLLL